MWGGGEARPARYSRSSHCFTHAQDLAPKWKQRIAGGNPSGDGSSVERHDGKSSVSHSAPAGASGMLSDGTCVRACVRASRSSWHVWDAQSLGGGRRAKKESARTSEA